MLEDAASIVPEVAIDIDGPSKSSVPQPVPNVADDDPSKNSKPQLVLNVADDDPTKNSGPQDGNKDGNNDAELMSAAFFAVGDCVTSITAIASNSPSSGHPVYLAAVIILSTVSVLAFLGALWLLLDPHKRRTAKRVILFASFAALIFGVLLDVYANKVKDKK